MSRNQYIIGYNDMGFTVWYRSTSPIDPRKRSALEAASDKYRRGRSWLACEPIYFIGDDDDGHIFGGSKPNFSPHPTDVAEAETERMPDGTIQDAINVLCRLSLDHDVDWEISHDGSDGPIGYIRDGRPDRSVTDALEAIGGWHT